MKKLLLLLLFLVAPVLTNAQSAYTLLRSVRVVASPAICREIVTRESLAMFAKDAALSQYPARMTTEYFRFKNNEICFPAVRVQSYILARELNNPQDIYGGYNFLRTISKLSSVKGAVSKEYAKEWKKIHESKGYNGAHHIVNKQALKAIVAYEKEQRELSGRSFKINLTTLENNAPAIFHPLHGDPKYAHIFHNPLEQFNAYKEHGMRYVICKQIVMINIISKSLGLPEMNNQVIGGILMDAEFWCRHHNLSWEGPTSANK